MPTNPRACAGSSPTQPSTRPSSKPSIGSPSWVNALLNAGVSQHQRALIAHCRGGWGIVGRGGVGHRCVVVWLWVCGCAGVWEVFIMYGCTLAREGKTTGPSKPFNMLPFSPPWRRTGRRRPKPECVARSRSLGRAMCCHILTRGRRCRRAALFKEGLGKPKACYTLSDVTLPEFRVI